MGEAGSVFQAIEVKKYRGKESSYRKPEKSPGGREAKGLARGEDKDSAKGIGEAVKREKREMSDEALVRRFVNERDDSAFVELLRRHEGYINRVLYVLFRGNREDIEDAKQEVFIELYRKLKRFRFESHIKTFVYSVVKNRAVDIIRKKERERKKLIHFIGAVGVKEQGDCVEDEYIDKERREEVLRAVFQLDNEERIMLVMRDYDSVPVKEIAKIFGMPEGTVKSRLHRSRERVINYLKRRGVVDG